MILNTPVIHSSSGFCSYLTSTIDSAQLGITSSLWELLILDDLITVRASDEEQVPILAYSRPGKGDAAHACNIE